MTLSTEAPGYYPSMSERHFPPPRSVEELDSCFVVRDANRQALAYMYFEKEPRSRFRRELLTRDEAVSQAAGAFGEMGRVKELLLSGVYCREKSL